MFRYVPAAVIAMLSICSTAAVTADDPAADRPAEEAERFFESRVRPLFVEHCQECHGARKQQAGLRLDSRAALLQGNDNGPAVVPGRPDKSRLIEVLRHDPLDVQMPPGGKLPDAAIETLAAWIRMGAPWPESPAGGGDEGGAADAWKTHWAFQPVARPPVPEVEDAAWPQTPIDHFIRAKLQENDLSPAPPADRATLLRRMTFGLTGLPPTVAEIEAFENDSSPEACAAVVDRLLASPRYGERWARYWLDVARYADTKGYVFTEDRNYPDAYRYRDWVIRALNDDLPYDRFLVLQIAADHVVGEDEPDTLAAMGFLTLGRRFLNNVHDIIDDRIDVVTRGTMALTVSCARCHDHKYDPVPTADYYSLYGVFRSSEEPKEGPPLRLVDARHAFEPRVFVRGSQGNQGEQVPRQFLMCVSGEDREPFEKGSGRLEMAEAIASPDNPLTARVLVNRVWGHHFGAGLVTTPSDFGLRSDPPSHPELLDWLAAEFIDSGWSVKALHRLILLSSVYQQSSNPADGMRNAGSQTHGAQANKGIPRTAFRTPHSVDPENRLLWKMNRQRLDFEAHRDALLAAAGQLELTLGGPSVKLTEQPFPRRRTVYGFIDRQNLPGMFRTFDFASPDTHSPQRFLTTVPQQSLFLMNSPFVLEQAAKLASRPPMAGAADPPAKIRELYRAAYGREPSAEELEWSLEFILNDDPADEPGAAWRYGYGEFDEGTGRIARFTRLPHWTGNAWQGGPQMPDPQTGWVTLRADGGHPGNDRHHAAIRRWIAPRDGTVFVFGTLKHPSPEGDGVEGLIVSSRTGVAGRWTVHHGESKTPVQQLEVIQGDTVDFVVHCRENPNHDSFHWTVSLGMRKLEEESRASVWSSATQFAGPAVPPTDVWQRYAQVLLLANEFVFVD